MHRLARLPLFWRFQLAGWTLFAVGTIPLKFYALHSLPLTIVVTLTREPLGLLLTSLLRTVYHRYVTEKNRNVRLGLIIVVLAAAIGGFDALLGRFISAAAGQPEEGYVTFGIFCFRGTLYVVWSLLYFIIRAQIAARAHELSLARAETAARAAELQLLRAQVDPHFLFNSLNTILATLDPGQERSRRVVDGLAAYLRYSLQHRHDTLVPLGAEFAATTAYLAVEQERFRGELLTDLRLDERARDFPVPGVLLQPLVENAVKYSRETSEPPYRLRLHIGRPTPDAIEIEVANTGSWVEPSVAPGPHGSGLANLRQRLALLYPDHHALDIRPADGWVVVRLRLTTSHA